MQPKQCNFGGGSQASCDIYVILGGPVDGVATTLHNHELLGLDHGLDKECMYY